MPLTRGFAALALALALAPSGTSVPGKPAPDVMFNRSFLRPKTERAFAKVGN
jgi:hypothetical protein